MSDLRVMSFNLRGSCFDSDGVNAWPHRAELNVETIHRYSPDLIGFQEFQTGNLETYRTALSAYAFELGPKYNHVDNYCYNACYWKPSRLKLLECGGVWLSLSPDR